MAKPTAEEKKAEEEKKKEEERQAEENRKAAERTEVRRLLGLLADDIDAMATKIKEISDTTRTSFKGISNDIAADRINDISIKAKVYANSLRNC